jgi:type II secretory pathway component GspD/PulD (secretin)
MKRLFAIALVALLAAPLVAQKSAAAKEETTYRKIESSLESTKLDTFAYEDADVSEVIKDIAKKCRITIVFDKKALEGLSADDRKITLELADIKASNALNIVVDQIGLHKAYKNGVLYITTKEKAEGATVTKTYDVRDITVKIKDFPAPKLRLRGEDEDSGPIFEYPEDEGKSVDTDEIVAMIEDSVDADWGGKATLKIVTGQLIITAPRTVHKKINNLLDQLRASK